MRPVGPEIEMAAMTWPEDGADFGVLRFSVEKAVETGEILRRAIRQEKPHSDYTRGLFTRGVL